MDFFEQVDAAKRLVDAHGRLTVRGIAREFEISDDGAVDVLNELVARGAARWDGDVVVSGQHALEGRDDTDKGELRHLTLMFCDVVGSTELSGRLGAESWSDLMRSFHEAARSAIESWGGHVGNYMGDGMVAYFGYPVALEDAAERAVRAGLGVLANVADLNAARADPAVGPVVTRVGIHTGPAVVDEFGGVVQAMGETANVAARIEGEAPVDGVAISPETRRLVSGVFVTADLGLRSLKGVNSPMAITQVLRVGGVAPRLGAGRAGLTPLVGRTVELGLLEDRWEQTREGWGQVTVVTGEAGIGKSRLVDTFRKSLGNQAHSWLDSACSPFARSSALYPMAELQRRGLGIPADATAAERSDRLREALEAVDLDSEAGLALLADLHGLEVTEPRVAMMSAERRRVELFDLLVDWVLALARLQPTVFFVDDVHWADPTTMDLLGRLVDRIATEQLMLIVTARPDRPPPWGARSNITPVQLARMKRREVAEVVRAAATSELEADIVASIVDRADGVPLFAEELAAAAARLDGDSAVPGTLQDLLMARLDQLGTLREIAQLASVIGREFTRSEIELLTPTTGNELTRLLDLGVDEELFYASGTAPATSYMFKHALMRDAVYESMLIRTRRRHHTRFSSALVDTRPLLAEERPELVAAHFREGGDQARAHRWWRRAAEQAVVTAAFVEAETFLTEALHSTGPDDTATEISVRLALAGVMNATRGFGHPDLIPHWENVTTLAERTGDARSLALAHAGHLFQCAVAGDFAGAHEHLATASDLADIHDFKDVHFGCTVGRSLMKMFAGWPLDAIVSADSLEDHPGSIAEYGRVVGIDVEMAPSLCKGYSEFMAGRFVTSAATFAAAEERSGAAADPNSRALLLLLHGAIWWWRGEPQSYVEAMKTLAEHSRRFDLPFYTAMGEFSNFTTGLSSQHATEANLDQAWELLNALGATGALIGAPTFLNELATTELAVGYPERAIATAQAGLDVAAQTTQHFVDPQLTAVCAQSHHQTGATPDDWLDDVDRATSTARERNLNVGRLVLATTRARLLADHARADEGIGELEQAINSIPEPDNAPIVTQARQLLDSLRR